MVHALTKGLKLRPNKGSTWETSTRQVELISSSTVGREVYWWVKRLDKSGSTVFDTFLGVHLLTWDKVQEFYKLGQKYRFKNGQTRDVYEIIELHLVERPISEDHREVALAKCHDHYSGKVYLTVLNRSDFDYMQLA
jgi:hypothetical protein